MSKADIHLIGETDEFEHQFRSLMRRLAGGVVVITAGRGDDITGMTVTSLSASRLGYWSASTVRPRSGGAAVEPLC